MGANVARARSEMSDAEIQSAAQPLSLLDLTLERLVLRARSLSAASAVAGSDGARLHGQDDQRLCLGQQGGGRLRVADQRRATLLVQGQVQQHHGVKA